LPPTCHRLATDLLRECLAQPFIDTSSDRGCALRASEAISDGGHDPRRFCGSAWPGDLSKHVGPSGEGQSYWSEAVEHSAAELKTPPIRLEYEIEGPKAIELI